MTESETLRQQIRSGAIDCRCPREVRFKGEHLKDCQWDQALKRIYEIERELDEQGQ